MHLPLLSLAVFHCKLRVSEAGNACECIFLFIHFCEGVSSVCLELCYSSGMSSSRKKNIVAVRKTQIQRAIMYQERIICNYVEEVPLPPQGRVLVKYTFPIVQGSSASATPSAATGRKTPDQGSFILWDTGTVVLNILRAPINQLPLVDVKLEVPWTWYSLLPCLIPAMLQDALHVSQCRKSRPRF